MGELTHLDKSGHARMVDVGDKPVTAREAVAEGRVRMAPATLQKALGTTIRVGNDVQVATDAEFKLGAGKPYKSVLGVFWGTGVGGGIILGGKPWLGRGGAGEIGHVVVKQGGAHCPCGRRGCMEAYAGRAALEAKARKRAEKGEKTKLFNTVGLIEYVSAADMFWSKRSNPCLAGPSMTQVRMSSAREAAILGGLPLAGAVILVCMSVTAALRRSRAPF